MDTEEQESGPHSLAPPFVMAAILPREAPKAAQSNTIEAPSFSFPSDLIQPPCPATPP